MEAECLELDPEAASALSELIDPDDLWLAELLSDERISPFFLLFLLIMNSLLEDDVGNY